MPEAVTSIGVQTQGELRRLGLLGPNQELVDPDYLAFELKKPERPGEQPKLSPLATRAGISSERIIRDVITELSLARQGGYALDVLQIDPGKDTDPF